MAPRARPAKGCVRLGTNSSLTERTETRLCDAASRDNPASMTFTLAPSLARPAGGLRAVILVLAALFVTHDAIYLARFGVTGYGPAMGGGGHGYWVPATMAIAAATLGVIYLGLLAYVRLHRAAGEPTFAMARPSYLDEVARLWRQLFPAVALLFLAQENLEHLAVDGHAAGITPLIGTGADGVLLVLAATTFVFAALGALVRWRIAILRARMAAATRRFARVAGRNAPRTWQLVGAIAAHGRMADRRDPCRPPPHVPPHVSLSTA
jgi:hypothetical protein